MKSDELILKLHSVLEGSDGKPIPFDHILSAAGQKSFGLAFIMLAVPAALPMPGFGISTPLGIVIAVIAIQLFRGHSTPWIPKGIRKLEIPLGIAKKIVESLTWVLNHSRKFFKPRASWMTTRFGKKIFAIEIFFLALAMQLPIPLTNVPPGILILFLALSFTEEDGLLSAITTLLFFGLTIVYAGLSTTLVQLTLEAFNL